MHNSYRQLYGMILESQVLCVSLGSTKECQFRPSRKDNQDRARSAKELLGLTTVIDKVEEEAGVGRESFQRATQV